MLTICNTVPAGTVTPPLAGLVLVVNRSVAAGRRTKVLAVDGVTVEPLLPMDAVEQSPRT